MCRNMSTDCVFLEVNPCFQKARVGLLYGSTASPGQPAADPYNVETWYTGRRLEDLQTYVSF